jgi:hypothetical protein
VAKVPKARASEARSMVLGDTYSLEFGTAAEQSDNGRRGVLATTTTPASAL